MSKQKLPVSDERVPKDIADAQAALAEAQNNKPKREFSAPRETRRVRVIRGGPMLPVNKDDPPLVYLEVRVSEWVSLGDGTKLGMLITSEEAERVGQIIERSIKTINTDRWPSLDGV
jgi:hypothetical protein